MSKKSTRSRLTQDVNAGSMADIAFLLLIFFLVTTTIDVDKGITVRLPPWSDEPPDPQKLNTRNVFSVLVNADNQLLVRGELMDEKLLREKTKEFILNPQKLENLSENPKKAIISLKNDRGTKYETYLGVYNELKAAYNELWDEKSQSLFGEPYEGLDSARKKEVRKGIPLILSEAEPTSFGEEN